MRRYTRRCKRRCIRCTRFRIRYCIRRTRRCTRCRTRCSPRRTRCCKTRSTRPNNSLRIRWSIPRNTPCRRTRRSP